MSDVLARCDGAGRTFGRGPAAVVAVHDATCQVDAGSRIALIGPSGSGKSTLLHLLAGLESPTTGAVTWPSWSGDPFGDTERVGLVFQGSSLIASMSALENAAFPLLTRGVSHEEAMSRAAVALDLLGLTGLAQQTPDELSGGQAQRVAVARVLTARPALVLADEPTGRLDRAFADRVVDQLLEAARHVGAGLVVATHDRSMAERLETTWRMRDGELAVPA